MNIAIDEKLVKRNRRIAQIASIGGLVILIGGMAISFQRQDMINISFASLIVGFILSQVGIYFTNRWGRSPRPDELLNQALKGLDSKYSIYHYRTPVPHLLVGPAGVWILMPRNQRGTISLKKGRWQNTGGGFIQAYLKLFGQESLGRPDLEIQNDIERLKKYLEKRMPEGTVLPDIQVALVFTNDQVDLQIGEGETPPAPTLLLNKLKELIRKTAKNSPLSMAKVDQIQQTLKANEHS